MSLKGRFPFRLGTSSYIIPDDILPNVEFLADRVDDVELILFESDEISNIPDTATVERLAWIAWELTVWDRMPYLIRPCQAPPIYYCPTSWHITRRLLSNTGRWPPALRAEQQPAVSGDGGGCTLHWPERHGVSCWCREV